LKNFGEWIDSSKKPVFKVFECLEALKPFQPWFPQVKHSVINQISLLVKIALLPLYNSKLSLAFFVSKIIFLKSSSTNSMIVKGVEDASISFTKCAKSTTLTPFEN
jgi:hypothetical protein